MAKAAKQESGLLADQMVANPPPKKKRRTWFDELTSEQQRQLLAVRDAYEAGKLNGWSFVEIREKLRAELKLTVGNDSIRRFLLRE